MKPIVVLAALLGIAMAPADRIDTQWHWAACGVETGEELFWGAKHTSYPATHLFDSDPRTAWVFSGLLPQDLATHRGHSVEDRESLREELESEAKGRGTRYWLTITPSRTVTIDGLRIMNGYNKSQRVFRTNRRVVEIEIWSGDHWQEPGRKPIKRAVLTDKMGWHRVSLPKMKVGSDQAITIRMTKFVGNPSDDVALSGLELLASGRVVDLHIPEVVDFTTGSD